MFREDICNLFWSSTQVSREQIFGPEDRLPNSSSDNSQHMWAGYVGKLYQTGGTVFVAHFPAGGTDAYDSSPHARNDVAFYEAIKDFKYSSEDQRYHAFEALNHIAETIIPVWDIYRVIRLALDGLELELDNIAFINAVPYRVLANRAPSAKEIDAAWIYYTGVVLSKLNPRRIIALGVAAGKALARHPDAIAPVTVLPRRIGDKSLHPEAIRICSQLNSDRVARVLPSLSREPVIAASIARSKSPATAPEDRFYVYILRKPDGVRTYGGEGTPFYVGIGQGQRMYMHEKEARETTVSSMKLETIRQILASGNQIIYEIDSYHSHEPWDREQELIHKLGRISDGTGPLTNTQTYSKSTKYEGVELRKYAEHHLSAGSLDAIPENFEYKSTRLITGPIEPASRNSVFGKIYTVLEANPGITGEQLVRLLQRVDFQGNKSAYTQSGKVCVKWISDYIRGGFYKKNQHIQVYKG